MKFLHTADWHVGKVLRGRSRAEEHAAVLRSLLDGSKTLEGLAVDADARWAFLSGLVAIGAAGDAEIDAEEERDATATGIRRAATARARSEITRRASASVLSGPISSATARSSGPTILASISRCFRRLRCGPSVAMTTSPPVPGPRKPPACGGGSRATRARRAS